jgi:hypothetical protein
MDDWQDAVFSTRHMHNRTGRGTNSKHTSAFDVRKSFGTYAVKCPAWQKTLNAADDAQSNQEPSLELYRLTENGEGVVGKLFLPGVLKASVILAGSRGSLGRTVAELEVDEIGAEKNNVEDEHEDTDEEQQQQNRFDTFEKNSFRSPKFWFRWSGVTSSSELQESDDTETDLGYVVFSGNDCRKFKGTINSSALEWKNVAITGHKTVSRSESDAKVTWGKDEKAM